MAKDRSDEPEAPAIAGKLATNEAGMFAFITVPGNTGLIGRKPETNLDGWPPKVERIWTVLFLTNGILAADVQPTGKSAPPVNAVLEVGISLA